MKVNVVLSWRKGNNAVKTLLEKNIFSFIRALYAGIHTYKYAVEYIHMCACTKKRPRWKEIDPFSQPYSQSDLRHVMLKPPQKGQQM